MGNINKIIQLYSEIMDELGIQWTEDNKDTPRRVAHMLYEMTRNLHHKPDHIDISLFDSPNDGYVTIEDIPFVSFCEHHHLPFYGKVAVSYLPDKKIIGLSKIPRIIEFFSGKPQVQERLTQEIGEFLVRKIQPKELTVTIYNCTHTCVLCRGIKSEGKTTTTYDYKPVLLCNYAGEIEVLKDEKV